MKARFQIKRFEEMFPGMTLKEPRLDSEYFHDCLEGRTRRKFYDFSESVLGHHGLADILELFCPSQNEDYFDWIDLFESVHQAEDKFQMIELGAAFGRWAAFGVLAARSLGKPIGRFGVYEAEPTHFRWIEEHFGDNRIKCGEHDIVEAAVGPAEGVTPFFVGCPSEWYGQSIAPGRAATPWYRSLLLKFKKAAPMDRVAQVKMLSLKSVLEGFERVDLIHMDIQGAELDVVSSAVAELNEKVRRLHIGTHSPDVMATLGRNVGEELKGVLRPNDWDLIREIRPNSTETVEGMEIRFVDGVQTWINAKLI